MYSTCSVSFLVFRHIVLAEKILETEVVHRYAKGHTCGGFPAPTEEVLAVQTEDKWSQANINYC